METHDKKLLVTIGDSWTEGVGCYLPEFLDKNGNSTLPLGEIYEKSQPRFLEYSWANVCAKYLGYDLINLGSGGASNSACAKKLLEGQHDWKSKYTKVVIVFLLSDPMRFSFYSNHALISHGSRGFNLKNDELMTHNHDIESGLPEFMQWYVLNVSTQDASKETAFYLRVVEYLCKTYNYEFYWGTAFTPIEEIIPYYKNDRTCLHKNSFSSFREYIFNKLGKTAFSYCHHPNEKGYQLIGEFIANYIKLQESI